MKNLLFLSTLLYSLSSYCQVTVDQYTLDAAGGEFVDGNGNTYMHSFGGVSVATSAVENDVFLTQGFEQPVLLDVPYAFVAPTAFTPDGDGTNDSWTIPLETVFDTPPKVLIFNRWGDVVYETQYYDNASNVWTGNYQTSGLPVLEGTYFYVVESNDDNTQFSGYIQLIRQ